MRRAAVDYYLAHGKSLAGTMRRMGCPASREYLCGWIDELAPGPAQVQGPEPKRDPVPVEKKVQVVAELEARTGPAAQIAEKHGVPRAAPYVWRREMMGDNGGGPKRGESPQARNSTTRQTASRCCRTCCERRRCSSGGCSSSSKCGRRPSR